MDEYGDFEQENYWEDDLYVLNQNEADDYRHENDGPEDDGDLYDETEEWED